jgi:hypothetical protein
MKLSNEQAHRIAALAIQLDAADQVLEKVDQTRAAREPRAHRDQLAAQLADAIAEVTERRSV